MLDKIYQRIKIFGIDHEHKRYEQMGKLNEFYNFVESINFESVSDGKFFQPAMVSQKTGRRIGGLRVNKCYKGWVGDSKTGKCVQASSVVKSPKPTPKPQPVETQEGPVKSVTKTPEQEVSSAKINWGKYADSLKDSLKSASNRKKFLQEIESDPSSIKKYIKNLDPKDAQLLQDFLQKRIEKEKQSAHPNSVKIKNDLAYDQNSLIDFLKDTGGNLATRHVNEVQAYWESPEKFPESIYYQTDDRFLIDKEEGELFYRGYMDGGKPKYRDENDFVVTDKEFNACPMPTRNFAEPFDSLKRELSSALKRVQSIANRAQEEKQEPKPESESCKPVITSESAEQGNTLSDNDRKQIEAIDRSKNLGRRFFQRAKLAIVEKFLDKHKDEEDSLESEFYVRVGARTFAKISRDKEGEISYEAASKLDYEKAKRQGKTEDLKKAYKEPQEKIKEAQSEVSERIEELKKVEKDSPENKEQVQAALQNLANAYSELAALKFLYKQDFKSSDASPLYKVVKKDEQGEEIGAVYGIDIRTISNLNRERSGEKSAENNLYLEKAMRHLKDQSGDEPYLYGFKGKDEEPLSPEDLKTDYLIDTTDLEGKGEMAPVIKNLNSVDALSEIAKKMKYDTLSEDPGEGSKRRMLSATDPGLISFLKENGISPDLLGGKSFDYYQKASDFLSEQSWKDTVVNQTKKCLEFLIELEKEKSSPDREKIAYLEMHMDVKRKGSISAQIEEELNKLNELNNPDETDKIDENSRIEKVDDVFYEVTRLLSSEPLGINAGLFNLAEMHSMARTAADPAVESLYIPSDHGYPLLDLFAKLHESRSYKSPLADGRVITSNFLGISVKEGPSGGQASTKECYRTLGIIGEKTASELNKITIPGSDKVKSNTPFTDMEIDDLPDTEEVVKNLSSEDIDAMFSDELPGMFERCIKYANNPDNGDVPSPKGAENMREYLLSVSKMEDPQKGYNIKALELAQERLSNENFRKFLINKYGDKLDKDGVFVMSLLYALNDVQAPLIGLEQQNPHYTTSGQRSRKMEVIKAQKLDLNPEPSLVPESEVNDKFVQNSVDSAIQEASTPEELVRNFMMNIAIASRDKESRKIYDYRTNLKPYESGLKFGENSKTSLKV